MRIQPIEGFEGRYSVTDDGPARTMRKTATRLQESREKEVEILTDTKIRNLVASQGIRLIDYAFLASTV